MAQAFEIGRELLCYRDEIDLVEIAKYLLCSKNEREELAVKGQQWAYRDHTYSTRLAEMVALVEK
jgi:spore maturation protein CgeB